MISAILKRLLPTALVDRLRKLRADGEQWLQRKRLRRELYDNFAYDGCRFWQFSALDPANPSRENLRAAITMDYHRLEKGLALKTPRPGFGVPTATHLAAQLRDYLERFGPDDVSRAALAALCDYDRFNQAHQVAAPEVRRLLDDQDHLLAELRQRGCDRATTLCSRDDAQAACAFDAARFFASRHSVRHFDDRPVESSLLERAVDMAITTPSVCNRQAWRVHVFNGADMKSRLLSMQNGNRGFAEQIAALVIVSCDLQCFVSAGERNQAWIDGGMFSMSLVLALHWLGLGSCCLNWSVTHEADRQLRAAAGIPDCEAIVMMIAVGHLPAEFRVTSSPRIPRTKVLTIDRRIEDSMAVTVKSGEASEK